MANYNPPTENLPIFDKEVFSNEDTPLTIGYADKHYLKYPNAQGTENLAAIVVNGSSTFNSTITANNTSTFNSTITSNSTSNFNSTVNINSTASFTSLNAPTSSQTLLPTADNSTKIPTTQWVQAVIAAGGGGGATSNIYTTNQVITMPTNCRSIDVLLMGKGGLAGTQSGLYYGGSGSGGNTLSCSNIPMSAGEQFTLTFDTTGSSITYNSVVIMKAFNGLNGGNAVTGFSVAGAATNTTTGISDINLGSFYNTFGNAGAGSTNNGLTPPSMAVAGTGCPKGTNIWGAGKYGCAESIPTDAEGIGYILITYHIGV